jgi:DHA1 family tetracycline resistance protein-like MFS transporter
MKLTTKTRIDQRTPIFILITMIIDGIGNGIIFSTLPLLLVELTGRNIPHAAVYGGWLTALSAAMQFFAAPILGSLSDRFGRRAVLLGSLTAFGINYLIMGFASEVGWLFIGAMLSGIFGATLSTANAYVADVTAPENLTKRFGMILAALGAGFILGPILVGVLEGYGVRAPFFVAAGFALLNVVYGFFVLPESLPEERRRPFSLARVSPLNLLAQMRKQPQILILLGALGLMQMAAVTPPVIWGYYTIQKFGWSQREIGMSLGLAAVLTLIVQGLCISYIDRRIGNIYTTYLGFSCMLISLVGYATSSRGEMMVAFMVPSALGSMTGAALISYMSKRTRADAQGELQGAIASISGASVAVTPPLVTQIFSFFSTDRAFVYFPGAPFLLASLLSFAGLLLAVHALRPSFCSKLTNY